MRINAGREIDIGATVNRWLAISIAAALLLMGGMVHGVYSERWTTSDVLDAAAAKVGTVPLDIDGWVGTPEVVDPAEYAQAGARAYWSRTYRKDGQEFLVILMAGRSGRMSVHTPEVCYRGAGFELNGSPSVVSVNGADGQSLGSFWSATFVKPAALSTDLHLLWSWSNGQPWDAPPNPRWKFASGPALYKLYISQDVSRMPADERVKNRDDFLRAFLPGLNAALGIERRAG